MSQSERAEIPETELIVQAIEGDASAFGTLYERYLDQIYRYIFYNVTDHVEAEDLTETVFLKAWEALPRFRLKGAAFRAWLYRIAHNVVVDRHRTHKPTASLEQVAHLQDASPTPETVTVTNQEIAELSAAFSQLKPRLRRVVLCRFVSGLSHAETAQVLDVTEGHVRVLQHRALRQMRRLLMEDGD